VAAGDFNKEQGPNTGLFRAGVHFASSRSVNPDQYTPGLGRSISVDRYTVGLEKIILDGRWSVELRMPFDAEVQVSVNRRF